MWRDTYPFSSWGMRPSRILENMMEKEFAGWIFHCNSQWSWYLANIYSYVQTYPLHLDLALWGSLHSVVDFNVYPLAKSASISFSIFFRLVPSWIVGSALLTIINGLSCQFVIFHLLLVSLHTIALGSMKSCSYISFQTVYVRHTILCI